MASREALEVALEVREETFEALDNVEKWFENLSYFVMLVNDGNFDIASACAPSALSSVWAFKRDWKCFRKGVEAFFEEVSKGVSNG